MLSLSNRSLKKFNASLFRVITAIITYIASLILL